MESTMVIGFEFTISTEMRRHLRYDFVEAEFSRKASEEIAGKIFSRGDEFMGKRWRMIAGGTTEAYSGSVYVFPYDYRQKLGKLALDYGVSQEHIEEFLHEALNF